MPFVVIIHLVSGKHLECPFPDLERAKDFQLKVDEAMWRKHTVRHKGRVINARHITYTALRPR